MLETELITRNCSGCTCSLGKRYPISAPVRVDRRIVGSPPRFIVGLDVVGIIKSYTFFELKISICKALCDYSDYFYSIISLVV